MPMPYDTLLGSSDDMQRFENQLYPQNIIHTFDTEHLCQAQCQVPCSMKHISDLMMHRWLCPLKEKEDWNNVSPDDRFFAGLSLGTVICLAILGVFLLFCISCLIRVHCCKCHASEA
ncbi:unnamed protein product [Thelazia callipaeda]|uniref:LITAF domain-containing protein n=1 Tax=Thelazia callipaeda TaxID=103827 RepID=A0A158RBT4_THECL|nr:unnamed protein product [Thelazia callipaeda]